MTTQDFNKFMAHQGWNMHQTAEQLGLHYQTVRNYSRGHRLEDPSKPIEIPKVVCLAAEALKLGVRV